MKTRVFAFITDNNKFLLIRESSLKFKNQWYLPGGALEETEDISSGLQREVKEEAGYEIGINGICFFRYVDRPLPRKGLYIYCSGRIISGKLKTTSDEHSMEAGWFGMNEISQLDLRGNLGELLSLYSPEMPLLPTHQVLLNVSG